MPTTTPRVTRAWRLTLSRLPSPAERETALRFIAGFSAGDVKAAEVCWTQLFQSLFATLDFRYVN